jgi:hypothetical protein
MQIQSIIILWTCENKNRWLFAIIVFYRNIRKNNWTKMSMLNVWSFHRIQIRDISNICGKIFEQCFFKIYVNLISKCIIIFIMIWNVYSYSVLKVIKLSSFSFFFFNRTQKSFNQNTFNITYSFLIGWLFFQYKYSNISRN